MFRERRIPYKKRICISTALIYRAKFFTAQVALALEYLHENEIVYGDLKPQNILVDKYGYIKLTDFGASRLLAGKGSVSGFAGTPDYLAPESLITHKITRSTDWWTFGILLYALV